MLGPYGGLRSLCYWELCIWPVWSTPICQQVCAFWILLYLCVIVFHHYRSIFRSCVEEVIRILSGDRVGLQGVHLSWRSGNMNKQATPTSYSPKISTTLIQIGLSYLCSHTCGGWVHVMESTTIRMHAAMEFTMTIALKREACSNAFAAIMAVAAGTCCSTRDISHLWLIVWYLIH